MTLATTTFFTTHKLLARRLVLVLAALLLASCRLVITTDETGSIISASGTADCNQASCAIEITQSLVETFTAVPADGYRFVNWEGVCTIAPTNVCTVTVSPLPAGFSEFDGDVSLSAVFEPLSTTRAWYRDADGDKYGTPNQSKMASRQPEGFVINDDDCDDSNRKVRPWTREKEDGQDTNCNGKVDEGFKDIRFYADFDGDGFGDPEVSILARKRPLGYARNKLDCNDLNPNDNPEADEVIDNRDNDCDGNIDEGANVFYRDVDGDGFGTMQDSIESLEPVDGYVSNKNDCDDNNDSIFPGAEEEFDSVDNDCDGSIDEGFSARTYYRDIDGDGFGDDSDTVVEVIAPDGYVTNGADNCVAVSNPNQSDIDLDGIGDACDTFTDTDDDGVQDSSDNCPNNYNPNQSDVDNDDVGDVCDSQNGLDLDNDGVNNESDNCPNNYNPNQADSDNDDIGDACDSTNNGGDNGGNNSCTLTAEEQAMLDAVNATRAQARTCGAQGSFPAVSPLSWSCELKGAALGHSMDMANNNFFDHKGSDGQSVGFRATQAGYVWSTVGENIAAGTPLSSVSAVVQAWIDSPGHCANLMRSSYTELGAAKFSNSSSNYNVYWTQVFGRPR